MAETVAKRRGAGRRHDLEERLDLLLATASHDLRAPLAGVKVAASTLASGELELRPDETRALAAGIVEEVDRLTDFITTVLDFQRLRADSLAANPRRVRVGALITAALAGPRAHNARVDISVPSSLPPVRTDPFLLGRVIVNLVD
ncbi:MAG TPA: histidine kinase dimerization/phospho-acceptor domain-containing protein, partial [Acidimicrobiales bacterium]|nr:histidine kinase dimerization/phospho-acceptor domain-containing protein [Acidimicrobiales bacterium]